MFRALVKSAPIQSILKKRHPPLFDVQITDICNELLAGETTHVCDVTVTLNEEYKRQNLHIMAKIPKPQISCTHLHDEDIVTVSNPTCAAYDHKLEALNDSLEPGHRTARLTVKGDLRERGTVEESLTLNVYICAYVEGKYSITPHFPNGTNVRMISQANGEFNVKALAPSRLVLSSVSQTLCKSYVDGHQIYRGEKRTFYMQAQDVFGNISNTLVQISANTSPYFSLHSISYDTDTRTYKVVIEGTQAGQTIMSLTFPDCQDVFSTSLKIFTPPMSTSLSRIRSDDVIRLCKGNHVFGKEIQFQVDLYDLLGNPLECQAVVPVIFELQLVSIHGMVSNLHKDKTNCKVSAIKGTSSFQITFTPHSSGGRLLSILLNGNDFGKMTPMLNVVPEPVLEVIFAKLSDKMVAGNSAVICRVLVTFDKEYTQRYGKVSVDIPKPTIDINSTQASSDVRVSSKETPHTSGDTSISLEVVVYATTAGYYSLVLCFPNSTKYKVSSNPSQAEFAVTPSSPARLVLLSVSPAYKGHGVGSKIYRGGKAHICAQVQDNFGNVSDDDSIRITIECPDIVSLVSSTFDSVARCYDVVIHGNQIGQPVITLSFPACHQVLTIRSLSIIIPPVSAFRSRICSDDVTRLCGENHVVGKEIKVRVELIDIFENPLPVLESKAVKSGYVELFLFHPFCKTCTVPEEKQSCRVRLLSGTSICEISFTPSVAGNRKLSVAFNNKTVGKVNPIINVVPEPDFEVMFMKLTGNVIAGNLVSVCRVSVTLDKEYTQCHGKVNVEIPKPTIHIDNTLSSSTVRVTSNEIPHTSSDTSISLEVEVYATTTGNYSLVPYFTESAKYKVTSDPLQAKFTVKPSSPARLHVLSRISPVYKAHGTGSQIYRGGIARLMVDALDSFGNISKNDKLQISVDSPDFVSLESCGYDSRLKCYDLGICCLKVGTPFLNLTFPGAKQDLSISLKIILPPLSITNSRIHPQDLSRLREHTHEIGKEIKFRVELYDRFGKPLLCSETSLFSERRISVNLRLDCFDCEEGLICDLHFYNRDRNLQKEEDSVRALDGQDSSLCEIICTPFFTGSRTLNVVIDGKQVGSTPLTVANGPLVEILPVKHQSIYVSYLTGERVFRDEWTWEDDDSDPLVSSYPTQERVFRVEERGEFDEGTNLDTSEWRLASDGPISQTNVTSCGSVLTFHYRFSEKGSYNVSLESIRGRDSYIKVPMFDIEVKAPPLDPERSDVTLDEDSAMLMSEGEATTIKLKLTLNDLLDCTGEEVSAKKIKKKLLTLKVYNEEEDSDLQVRHNFSNGYSFSIDGINEAGQKEFQAFYDGRPFGKKLSVTIIRIEEFHQDEYLNMVSEPLGIMCTGVPRWSVIGPDNANIQNINRVLQLHFPESECKLFGKKVNRMGNGEVHIDLKNFDIDAAKEFLRLLSLIIEGNFYRKQGGILNGGRAKWKEKAMAAIEDEDYTEERRCNRIKNEYSPLMDASHRKASDAIFKFFNDSRTESEIDLHGQHTKNIDALLSDYRKQLMKDRRLKEYEVQRRVERMRENVEKEDEAITKLKHRLNAFTKPWLEIIYGAGHHSQDGVQKIKPNVIKFLKMRGWNNFVESNEGAMLVTFQEYTGSEPCLASFYCKKCKRAWQSSTSWKGNWQLCYKCDQNQQRSECLPCKLREVEERPRAGGTREVVVSRRDHRRLCQKCVTSGMNCSKLTKP